MPSHHDSAGRPIVVVTGMGVVTSLGAGKAENWKKLTAGKSGIQEHHPLCHRWAEDPLRRHRRFRAGRAAVVAGAVGAAGRHGGGRGRRRIRHRQPRRFPGPAVHRGAADRDRMGAAPPGRGRLRRERQCQLYGPHPHRGGREIHAVPRALHVRLGRQSSGGQVRHQGLADLALDRLRVGRDRDPARRRGDPPRRSRAPRSASAPTARSIRNR